jgi:hypothetical protein
MALPPRKPPARTDPKKPTARKPAARKPAPRKPPVGGMGGGPPMPPPPGGSPADMMLPGGSSMEAPPPRLPGPRAVPSAISFSPNAPPLSGPSAPLGVGQQQQSPPSRGVGAGRDLNMAARKKLPSSSFALPGKGEGPTGKGAGSYPIPDRGHAQAALSRVAQHGTPAEKATVKAKVKSKFGMGNQGKKKK